MHHSARGGPCRVPPQSPDNEVIKEASRHLAGREMTQKARRRDRARKPVQVTHFEEKIFYEWPLKNGDRMRVSVGYFAGHDIVHIRRYPCGIERQAGGFRAGADQAAPDNSLSLVHGMAGRPKPLRSHGVVHPQSAGERAQLGCAHQRIPISGRPVSR